LLLATFRGSFRFGLYFGEEILTRRRIQRQQAYLSVEGEGSSTLFVTLLLNNHYRVGLHSYILHTLLYSISKSYRY